MSLADRPTDTSSTHVHTADDKYKEYYIENPYYHDGDRPMPAYALATTNFVRQGSTLLVQAAERLGLIKRDPLRPPECLKLKLKNEDVTAAERQREAAGGRVDAHPVSRALYDAGCAILDNLFNDRPIPR